MKKNSRAARKKVAFLLFCCVVVSISVAVYFLAVPGDGSVPPMPEIEPDKERLNAAMDRLQKRASSVKPEEYHRKLFDVFYNLNLAETGQKPELGAVELMMEFQKRSLIARTAKKERFLLAGDLAAVRFEKQLEKVLRLAKKRTLSKLVESEDEQYQELLRLGGNFLFHLLKMKKVTDDGRLLIPKYIPQIAFRRRWRMLGGLPHRYRFLKIEALVDQYYLLKNSSCELVDRRIRAARAVEKYYPGFDLPLAEAIVYFEGGESKKAKAVLKTDIEKGDSDFKKEQFMLYLETN